MNITIVGNGAWGTAIAFLLQINGHTVTFCKKGETLNGSAATVLAIPTQAIRSVLQKAKNFRPTLVVNAAKGIEQQTHLLPFQIVKEVLGPVDYFSLIGPSFAKEVMERMPTLVNIGYQNKRNAKRVKDLFQTDFFRIKLYEDVAALELSGAFKNVYAIVAGLSKGLGFGINTRTKLVLLGLEEVYGLCRAFRYPLSEDATPGIVGDMILTCNSLESRNFTFGKLIAKHKVQDALAKINATVEGYHTIASVSYFTKNTGVKLPLATLVKSVVNADNPKEAAKRFTNFVKAV